MRLPSLSSLPLLALLVVGFGASCAGRQADAPADTAAPAKAVPGVTATAGGDATLLSDSLVARADSSRIMGSPSAKVWLIIVSDFQCPYCERWHATVAATLRREYVTPGKVRMAYIHLPIKGHQHAMNAAEASMCAGVDGKFWQAHDAIFAAQQRWTPMEVPAAQAVFDSLALGTGVDAKRYRDCLASDRMLPMIQADNDRAVQAGVRSTPTILVQGRSMVGLQPVENYRRAIDEALAAAK